MLLTTTPSVEGKHITAYYGVVSGETIIGANFLRDFMASVRDFLGGRSKAYEEVLREAKAKQPKARQFMLDIDGNNENAELVLSGK